MKKHDIQHSLIVVAEAVKKEDGRTVLHKYMDGEQRLGGIGDYIAKEIMKKTDIECRVTTLGHVQRGAPPTASDRILASAFGVYAVDLLNQQKFDRMVAWKNRKVVDVPLDEGINTYKNVERKDSLVETALSLNIYIGDNI
jgi:6-phosphofructokinase 1